MERIETWGSFREIRKDKSKDRFLLFRGTPCPGRWWKNARIIRFERPQQGQPGITLANDLSGGTGGPGAGGVGSVGGTSVGGGGGGGSSLPTTALSLDHQQFNIFPAIFSRQLNFSAAAAANCGQNKLMDELRPNLGLLGVGLVENDTFHLNQEKRKCSSTSSNEQDFSLYGVHQGLEASPPTPAATPGRSSVGATSTVGEYISRYISLYLSIIDRSAYTEIAIVYSIAQRGLFVNYIDSNPSLESSVHYMLSIRFVSYFIMLFDTILNTLLIEIPIWAMGLSQWFTHYRKWY